MAQLKSNSTVGGKAIVVTDDSRLSDARTPIAHDHPLKADKTYVDNKVLTDVPSGAKFTDTITTINGKTGTITKADITALGIPAQDTTYGTAKPLYTGLMGSYLFYPHPEFERIDANRVHDATYDLTVTQSIAKLDVDKANKTQVLADVPLNAKFTDTITTINGKTGTISKADIVALGIPAQDTVYTHPTGTNPHGTTKSDVGLGNVDNIKQMPISGGVLENYTEKLTTVSSLAGDIYLNNGNVFVHTPSGARAYRIHNPVSGVAHSFTLIINMGSTVRALTFPASVKWQGGETPDMTTANKTYVLTFMSVDGGANWLGMFGGEF